MDKYSKIEELYDQEELELIKKFISYQKAKNEEHLDNGIFKKDT